MLQFLKKSFLWIVLLLLILYVVIERPTLVQDLQEKYFSPKAKACEKPIEFHVGTFDTRFGISEKDFLIVVNQAVSIWNKALDKPLLQYVKGGDNGDSLRINLIYDARQQSTQQNALLQANVEKISSLASTLKAQYTSLQNQYQVSEKVYKELLDTFKVAQEKYTASVSYWNRRGGAPEREFRVLDDEKNNLIKLQDALEIKRLEVNRLANQINSFIKEYNLLISDANSNIKVINASSGEFEEGIYDPNDKSITIYQFDTKVRLLRVLAHEFGHALGLGHNTNVKSIMYAYNIDRNEVLTPEDLADLRAVCEKK